MAWDCQNCGESLEEAFDACWKCGTSRGGTADPGFAKQRAVVTGADPHVAQRMDFTCAKCSHSECRIETLRMERDVLSLGGRVSFTVLSCASCGFSELYRN